MIPTRRDYSLDRLRTLGERLDPVRPLLAGKPICLYATGSYGRLEGWSGSDVDLFFLYDGEDESDRFPWTTFAQLASCRITATEEMGFPPFSGDGKYLEVLYVRDIERVLGSPEDDSTNAFTARMLLLLESQPIYDEVLYGSLLERIIGFYYRDFRNHANTFVPGFLINDILRFWRTLTLNYEHSRLELRELAGEELRRKKAKSALKNYKLKVSRMSTCFSMVANLSSEPRPVTAGTVHELCRMTRLSASPGWATAAIGRPRSSPRSVPRTKSSCSASNVPRTTCSRSSPRTTFVARGWTALPHTGR